MEFTLNDPIFSVFQITIKTAIYLFEGYNQMKCPMMWNPFISKLRKQWSEKEMEADIINNGKMKSRHLYWTE